MDHSLHQLRWSLFQKPMVSNIKQAALNIRKKLAGGTDRTDNTNSEESPQEGG